MFKKNVTYAPVLLRCASHFLLVLLALVVLHSVLVFFFLIKSIHIQCCIPYSHPITL